MSDDAELLRHYAERGEEAAFAELVRRHLDLVYGVALRKVGGDAHFAEDVAQRVFVDLARKARELSNHPVLAGWLFTSAHYAATQIVRVERRRRAREEIAQAMNISTAGDEAAYLDWDRLRPLLDDLIRELDGRDRDAVILRYFEGRSFGEVGARLRLSEDGARSRVERSLDRLHVALARRGITSTAAALGTALANQAGAVAPAGLAASVTGTALATAAAGAGGGGIAVFMSMSKLQLGMLGTFAVAGATGLAWQAQTNTSLRREIAALQEQQKPMAALQNENRQLAASVAEVEMLRRDDAELKQLEQRVAGARQMNAERAKVVAARAQVRARDRIKELQEELRAMDRQAQEEVDRMNREGNALVEAYKALSARAKNEALSASERTEAETAAKTKMDEIKAKQLEVKTFIENIRRSLNESPQLAEVRALELRYPPTPEEAAQQRAEEQRTLERRAAEVRLRSSARENSSGRMELAPKP